jgi:hypothetical protein
MTLTPLSFPLKNKQTDTFPMPPKKTNLLWEANLKDSFLTKYYSILLTLHKQFNNLQVTKEDVI